MRLVQFSAACAQEHNNEVSRGLRGGEFLEPVSDYQLLKKYFAR
jgi:hypothetical protein